MHVVDTVLGAIDRLIRALLVAVVGVMVVVVFAQVVARYGLNSSFGWADEISRLAFVTMVFLGIAVAVRARAHIGITLVADALPALPRAVLGRAVMLGCAALSALVSYEAVMITLEQWDERMISVELSAAWFLVPVIGGMAVSAANFVATALGLSQAPADQHGGVERL
jgi:TRAP-type C4-dicarboxylate transport system permease small subunit